MIRLFKRKSRERSGMLTNRVMKRREATPRKPLQGFRIVTLAINVPVPVAVSRLCRLGATVVKIEPPGGDPLETKHCPKWYKDLVTGQRVMRLNLKESKDRARLDSFLANSDLLLTSSRPDSLRRLSLGWKELHSKFPKLSHIALLGHPAPREGLSGHDLTYQARLGLIVPPTMPSTLWADLAAAESVFSTALILLFSRRQLHSGLLEQVTIEEATRRFAAPLHYGLTAPGGLLGGGLPQYNLYRASDDWVAVSAMEPHFLKKLQEELGLLRVESEQLASAFRARTAGEWDRWAIEHDIPLTAVRGFGEME
jgi:alpha-methylacyl-CoA racemase